MKRLFVDTSAWFAFVNHREPDHRAVRATLEEFEGRLVTSNYVFDETVTLCLYRLGHAVASRVGDVLHDRGVVDLLRVTPADERAAWELFCGRADKTYSFTDCTSFVMLRNRKIGHVVALDDDFRREGFTILPDATSR